jgi:hypothetical protein
VVAGVLIVVAVVGAAVALLLGEDGPGHPKQWDARVLDLVDFVADERGLEFDHPVYVDFLTPDQYTEQTTSSDDEIDDESRAELDVYAGELRAMGLASGELDLFDAYNQVSDAGTLAFYDPTDERIRVRGTEMSLGLQVTLVHELTHALQDQHFDLERLDDELTADNDGIALRALIEGDAIRIEEQYVADELDEDDQAAYDEEYAGELDASIEATKDVPAFISASFSVPYALGVPFVLMLVNEDGNDAVDEAFESPPDTEDDLFDPSAYLAEEEDVERNDVDLDLDEDLELHDDGVFGSPSWHLLLAERVDPMVAFEAARGWGGDAYATFERDGMPCVRSVFVGDTREDEQQMADALEAWAAGMPGGRAETIEVDGHPGFDACDPGEELDMQLSSRSEEALGVPSIWGYLVADAASVLDVEGARCYASGVLESLTFDQIAEPEGTAFVTQEFQHALTAAFERCQ